MTTETVDFRVYKNPEFDHFHYDQVHDYDVIQKAGSSVEVFNKVVHAVNTQHLEVINTSVLKELYYLLVYLSSYCSPDCAGSRNLNDWGIKSHQFNYTVKFTDICKLANFLFNELSRKFEQLFSDVCVVSVRKLFEESCLRSDSRGPQQELTLLLRCCMVMLPLVELDQCLLSHKCQVLLTILRRLCSSDLLLNTSRSMRGTVTSNISFNRSVSCEMLDGRHNSSSVEECDAFLCSAEESNAPISTLCSILEVFVDELLVHRKLRQYLVNFDSVSCTTERLFTCCFSHGDIDSVLELISAHFFLVVSNEQAFKRFLEKSFWQHERQALSPQLSLSAALQLLGTSVKFSAPQIFQAYVISLVSESVVVNMILKGPKVDLRVVNIYMSAFERSVILYIELACSLQLDGILVRPNGASVSSDKPCKGFCSSYEYYVRPGTYNDIKVKISSFNDSYSGFISKPKSDLLSRCSSYIKENEHIVENSQRDQVLSIMNCLVTQSLSGAMKGIVVYKSENLSMQKMYLLGSIIKLMSASLLQTIKIMQGENLGCRKTLKDYVRCKEYDFLAGIFSCFWQQSNANQSSQLLPEVMEGNPRNHKQSKMMFMHFLELLLYSFGRGHEFLWKGCVLMMMTLMNLIIFEDGNLEQFKLLLGFAAEPLPSKSATKSQEVAFQRKSSLVITSKFEKIRKLNLRSSTTCNREVIEAQHDHSRTSRSPLLIKDVEGDDTGNGESYLNLFMRGDKKPDDFDDLANFIACKPEKDYTSWLKGAQKFRKWKMKKRDGLRQKKKKKLLKLQTSNVVRKLKY